MDELLKFKYKDYELVLLYDGKIVHYAKKENNTLNYNISSNDKSLIKFIYKMVMPSKNLSLRKDIIMANKTYRHFVDKNNFIHLFYEVKNNELVIPIPDVRKKLNLLYNNQEAIVYEANEQDKTKDKKFFKRIINIGKKTIIVLVAASAIMGYDYLNHHKSITVEDNIPIIAESDIPSIEETYPKIDNSSNQNIPTKPTEPPSDSTSPNNVSNGLEEKDANEKQDANNEEKQVENPETNDLKENKDDLEEIIDYFIKEKEFKNSKEYNLKLEEFRTYFDNNIKDKVTSLLNNNPELKDYTIGIKYDGIDFLLKYYQNQGFIVDYYQYLTFYNKVDILDENIQLLARKKLNLSMYKTERYLNKRNDLTEEERFIIWNNLDYENNKNENKDETPIEFWNLEEVLDRYLNNKHNKDEEIPFLNDNDLVDKLEMVYEKYPELEKELILINYHNTKRIIQYNDIFIYTFININHDDYLYEKVSFNIPQDFQDLFPGGEISIVKKKNIKLNDEDITKLLNLNPYLNEEEKAFILSNPKFINDNLKYMDHNYIFEMLLNLKVEYHEEGKEHVSGEYYEDDYKIILYKSHNFNEANKNVLSHELCHAFSASFDNSPGRYIEFINSIVNSEYWSYDSGYEVLKPKGYALIELLGSENIKKAYFKNDNLSLKKILLGYINDEDLANELFELFDFCVNKLLDNNSYEFTQEDYRINEILKLYYEAKNKTKAEDNLLFMYYLDKDKTIKSIAEKFLDNEDIVKENLNLPCNFIKYYFNDDLKEQNRTVLTLWQNINTEKEPLTDIEISDFINQGIIIMKDDRYISNASYLVQDENGTFYKIITKVLIDPIYFDLESGNLVEEELSR